MVSAGDSTDFSVCPLVEAGNVDQEQEFLVSAPKTTSHRRTLIGTALALVGLATGTVYIGSRRNASQVSFLDVVGFAAKGSKAPCAAEDGDCSSSECCVPGGSDGLQCFAKNDDYAACASSCEPGVHEPEKEGTWDASGTFQKVQWSCNKLGKRSESGCETFQSESKCPSEYCAWKGKSCMPSCDTFGAADGCWKSKHCMWEDDKCMDACWDMDSAHSCAPKTKCHWTGKKCQMGWWLFNSEESCDQDLGYMWNGSCVKDPCSAPFEDCTNTKCCSKERGGSGMTCFKKDKFYATCQETCEKSDKWDCEPLGKRTNYSAGCAWAGKSCASEKKCCNRGFVCAVKDEDWTACVQTIKKTTWVTQHIPIPSDWDGTVVGPGNDEYEMQQAGPDEEKLGTTLYCWMAFLPGSYEEGLIAVAKKNKASIYACDAHDLFHTWETTSGAWDTGEATLTNTDVFINVWEQVQKVGQYINYDWTVKVDPDCVVAPDRLRNHLAALNMPKWAAVYVKNNGMDPGLGNNGFLGAIEVFSQKAVTKYLDNSQGCLDALGLNAGEDGFFKGCMDALGIGFASDLEMFFPDQAAGACTNEGRAAFHPLKDPDEWQHCWDILLGKSEW